MSDEAAKPWLLGVFVILSVTIGGLLLWGLGGACLACGIIILVEERWQ
jgi:hypothetical protein